LYTDPCLHTRHGSHVVLMYMLYCTLDSCHAHTLALYGDAKTVGPRPTDRLGRTGSGRFVMKLTLGHRAQRIVPSPHTKSADEFILCTSSPSSLEWAVGYTVWSGTGSID
jgi:hypothetical protein